MKSTVGLLRQVKLGLTSLLPVVIGACKRDAPRYEPDSSIFDVAGPMITPDRIEPSITNMANGLQPSASILNRFPKPYKGSQELVDLLKDIDDKQVLISEMLPPADPDLQNNLSACIDRKQGIVSDDGDSQSNRLPDTLCIFFSRHLEDGSWDKRILVNLESRGNEGSPNSENHAYSLTRFLIAIPAKKDVAERLVAFVQVDKQWYYYHNDDNTSAKKLISTQDAMRLASERGVIFLYEKSKPLVKGFGIYPPKNSRYPLNGASKASIFPTHL